MSDDQRVVWIPSSQVGLPRILTLPATPGLPSTTAVQTPSSPNSSTRTSAPGSMTSVAPEGERSVDASHLLLSIGRVPNTDALDLEKAGVQRAPNGYIPVVDTQTNVPHVYAAGDISEDVAVANVAELEGRHAVEREMDCAGLGPVQHRHAGQRGDLGE